MMRRLVLGFCLMSATMLSPPAFAADSVPLQIIVSKDKQSLTVYEGETVIATSRISSGKAGHDTPTGIFSILEKRKYHESNIYSNAPMPFMQRITWSGIALHEGNVPNYPASHGCVRLPSGFATKLYGLTERGAHVIVTDADVVPKRIEDVVLFSPRKPLPPGTLMTDVDLRTASIKASPKKPVEVAMNVAPANPNRATDALPPRPDDLEEAQTHALRILITRRTDRETLMDAQKLLEEMGFETGGSDGYAGPLTRSAVAGFKRWKGLKQTGPMISGEFIDALYASAGQPKPPAGQIMVRQNFEPLFEAPVGIKAPEVALGTHLFTVDKIDRSIESADWHAVTLPNVLSDATMKRLGITMAADAKLPGAAKAALDRIEISQDVRDRIETLMADGTSVTINDEGLGPETGKGTDFVTLTKTAKSEMVAVQDIGSTPAAEPRAKRSVIRYQGGVGLY
jgi:peptidoglycan hydrolase-like protein with peptidoglycan-binding domain